MIIASFVFLVLLTVAHCVLTGAVVYFVATYQKKPTPAPAGPMGPGRQIRLTDDMVNQLGLQQPGNGVRLPVKTE